ncbi:hypothetical protein FRC08_018288 [Ceratobasidium sp. 394]|nr:hypothetical protein FRC08_018288 [Ceratobasidium sp. 394]
MQSIIGYSDDDRSDDELKRPSTLKTLSKPKSKDTLKPIPITIAPSSIKASTSSASGSLANEPRNREDADSPSESKSAARSGKSKAGLNGSIIRRTTSAQPTKPTEQPEASTSNTLNERERETPPQQTPVEPNLQDLSLGPNPTSTSDGGELAQIRALLQPPPIPGLENFGIPPPSEDKVDPELAVSSTSPLFP